MKPFRGFTLLEILLVLVLVAVSAVAVIATFPVSQQEQAKGAAQSLYQRIQLLNEDAILSGRDFGLSIDQESGRLSFLTLTAEGWQLIDKQGVNAELDVDAELEIDFRPGGNVWQQDDRLFEPGSLFDQEMFEQNKQQKAPQIFILSSGEVTPFILSFHSRGQQDALSWRVAVEDNGQIQLLAPGEQDE